MTEDLKNIIGKNIKKYRELHNETTSELAESIGVAQSAVSNWENGNKMPRAGSIEKLAEHWNILKSQILTPSNEPQDSTPELRAIQRGARQLSKSDQEKLIKMMKITFDKLDNNNFDEDDSDDDL